MTLVKSGLKYEETGNQNIKVKADRGLERFNSWTLIWHLVRRHKYGLTLTWAIGITILYFCPFLPALVISVMMGW